MLFFPILSPPEGFRIHVTFTALSIISGTTAWPLLHIYIPIYITELHLVISYNSGFERRRYSGRTDRHLKSVTQYV